jgi:5-carboxymethyl-2-hydroxymuconate isomerase
MPHIHLETTSDLPENAAIPDILAALVTELCRHDTMQSKSVKAYHSLRSNWAMGDGAPAGIAHVTVSVLAGRPESLRVQIADSMWNLLQEQFSESLANKEVSLTFELREMASETYRKLA